MQREQEKERRRIRDRQRRQSMSEQEREQHLARRRRNYQLRRQRAANIAPFPQSTTAKATTSSGDYIQSLTSTSLDHHIHQHETSQTAQGSSSVQLDGPPTRLRLSHIKRLARNHGTGPTTVPPHNHLPTTDFVSSSYGDGSTPKILRLTHVKRLARSLTFSSEKTAVQENHNDDIPLDFMSVEIARRLGRKVGELLEVEDPVSDGPHLSVAPTKSMAAIAAQGWLATGRAREVATEKMIGVDLETSDEGNQIADVQPVLEPNNLQQKSPLRDKPPETDLDIQIENEPVTLQNSQPFQKLPVRAVSLSIPSSSQQPTSEPIAFYLNPHHLTSHTNSAHQSNPLDPPNTIQNQLDIPCVKSSMYSTVKNGNSQTSQASPSIPTKSDTFPPLPINPSSKPSETFSSYFWNRKTFKNSDIEITRLQQKLNQLINRRSCDSESTQISEIQDQINQIRKREEVYWSQRSRIQWLRWGDSNTRFFHASTIQRRARNRILRIQDENNNWFEGHDEVLNMITRYFKEAYKAEPKQDPQSCLQVNGGRDSLRVNMEGGHKAAGKAEFTECWNRASGSPYIMLLALSAGIGGLLFGYDTGVISGALLYIREDFDEVDKKTWLQETIVSMAVAGAIFGAAFGGWMNDYLGRRKSILAADVLFFIGAIVMAVAPAPWLIIIGRVFVGLGVGMASMTAPLYISEASPHSIRGALVCINGLLITGGQFLAYLINLAFTKAPGTWRWMLGVAGVPALVQFVLMLYLPESPRWLYSQGMVEEARGILVKIYHASEVEEEMRAMQESVDAEKKEDSLAGNSFGEKLKSALGNVAVRRALYAGVAVQVAQQFVGINTVMYYSPTIVQYAGIASKSTALALSLVTSGLNAVGSIISMISIDRYGRRRLMIISMIGIIVCLVVLSATFYQAAKHAPAIDDQDTLTFGANSTCQAYTNAPNLHSWNCMQCLQAECAFCANSNSQLLPGACLAAEKTIRSVCRGENRVWFSEGCPSKIGVLAVIILGVYILAYSPGMGTVPWVLNSEIYPLRFRGLGGGIAAVSNWCANLIVSESFLSMTEALGSAGTFLLFAGFSLFSLIAIYALVPETKGLQFEEVEKLLQNGFNPFHCPFSKKQEQGIKHQDKPSQ
ncbi:hypothetical protein RJT34_29654 [Clitoria ternatea]|uniref:Major facilitator superfamily (MFS) profile domain-containing protein n=1 Tax=Clitoria ternatea TaxID=43366 RepID=A0AAN9ER02_CLITE